jgi:hypothetical protein
LYTNSISYSNYLGVLDNIGWLLGVETIHDQLYVEKMLLLVQANQNHRTISSLTINMYLPPLDPCGPGWMKNNPNPIEHSYAMFASILLHLSKPDTTSVQVAHHLLQLGGRPPLLRTGNPTKTKSIRASSQEPKKTNTSNDKNIIINNNMWYYFRSYQCRRFIGQELANALLLQYHPLWYRRYEIHVYSTIYMLLLRFYTWISIPKSPFHYLIYKWHQSHLTKFISIWKRKLNVQNTNSLRTDSNSSNANEIEQIDPLTASNIMSDTDCVNISSTKCPFAMIAPPQY